MYTIGIDLGGTHIAVGLVDENFNIVKKISAPTLAQRGPYEITKDMAALSAKVCEECGLNLLRDVKKVGIAAPGTVNPSTGLIEYSNNIKMRDFPVVKKFAEFSGVAEENIAIGNDANLAALGEATAGAAKGAECAVMITLGTGVGGGIVINKQIYSGSNGLAAEIGHFVIKMGGEKCGCGRQGCFEAYGSATALIRMTKAELNKCFMSGEATLMAESSKISARTAFDAFKQGDKAAARVIEEYTDGLANGIASLVNIFQPDVFIIGGGISGEGQFLIDLLQPKFDLEDFARNAKKRTKLCTAMCGNDAGIIGAAFAV
jgi:glucokinase